jgi:hypothetical protein
MRVLHNAKSGLTIIRASKGILATCPLLVDDTPPLASSSSGIVINEFRVRGPKGGDDEFIELRNDASTPIALGGWSVKASPRSLN